MTQPSPQDDLPPGPWTVFEWTDHWSVMDATGCGFAHAWKERDARAIAAIPEMRAELEQWKDRALRGRAILKEISECDAAKENDRLRAEKAELQAEIERWDETDPLVNKRLKEDLQEILTLRTEKAELIEMLATRTTHPEYVELLRRYKPANETEA